MFTTGKGRGDIRSFGSKKTKKVQHTTRLPPKNYIKMNEQDQIQTPNLINIYRHEYKSKHFQFGTS